MILLTGFGPFLSIKENKSEILAKEIALEFDLMNLSLPVDYHLSFEILKEQIINNKIEKIICLGVSSQAQNIIYERIAINWMGGQEDISGNKLYGMIAPASPAGLFSTLPIDEMLAEVLSKNLQASISLSAGSYLCNYIFYQMQLYILKNQLPIKSGFIHLPVCPSLNDIIALKNSIQFLTRY